MCPSNSILTADWEFWNRLREDRDAYAAEKERIAAACANAIDARYPGFKGAIEVTDVATPLTFERYTGNWKGTFMTWQLSPDFQRKYGYVRKTVPGLETSTSPGLVPGTSLKARCLSR